jgi:hypothetical protein
MLLGYDIIFQLLNFPYMINKICHRMDKKCDFLPAHAYQKPQFTISSENRYKQKSCNIK